MTRSGFGTLYTLLSITERNAEIKKLVLTGLESYSASLSFVWGGWAASSGASQTPGVTVADIIVERDSSKVEE